MTKPHKLLVFSPYFWPHKGGHEKYVEELCARLVTLGWNVDIITGKIKGTQTQEIYRGMRVLRFPFWDALSGRYPVPKPTIYKLLRELSDYDVVMTHTRFFVLSLIGTLFARIRNTPQFHVEHGTCHPPVSRLINPLVWIYDHFIGVWVIVLAHTVAGVSGAAQAFAQHLWKRKTVRLLNSINTSFFTPEQTIKKNVIAYVGRLIQAKGVQDLFTAAGDLNMDLWIIGTGNYESHLRSIAPQNAKFLGEKNSQEIRNLLSQAQLFVNPSYNEGLPTSVLEAGAMGIPVIATDVGGTREIIDSGKNGYLVQSKKVSELRLRIIDLLKHPLKAKRMGLALQKKVRAQFDWDATSKTADKLLRKLVNK